nr:hypothetical protein [uncultured Prevotella sp.]
MPSIQLHSASYLVLSTNGADHQHHTCGPSAHLLKDLGEIRHNELNQW